MRIAITDDRPEDQARLYALLERECTRRKLTPEYDVFSRAEDLMRAFSPGQYQIVFLDIYMDGMTGMEAARKLYADDPNCRLIFYTSSRTDAVESYTVRAAYYLTKPVDPQYLHDAMEAACAGLADAARQICVCCCGVKTLILLKNILYLDCCAEHPQLHLKSRVLTLDDRVADLAAQLETDKRFLCCNRSTVVNLDWVRQATEGDFLMKNGDTVPIRQRGRAAVKKAFLQYSLRGLQRGGLG